MPLDQLKQGGKRSPQKNRQESSLDFVSLFASGIYVECEHVSRGEIKFFDRRFRMNRKNERARRVSADCAPTLPDRIV
jgi:hypothetical protein